MTKRESKPKLDFTVRKKYLLFSWKKCLCCEGEFKHEYMYRARTTRASGIRPRGEKWFCLNCAKSEEEVVRMIKDFKFLCWKYHLTRLNRSNP